MGLSSTGDPDIDAVLGESADTPPDSSAASTGDPDIDTVLGEPKKKPKLDITSQFSWGIPLDVVARDAAGAVAGGLGGLGDVAVRQDAGKAAETVRGIQDWFRFKPKTAAQQDVADKTHAVMGSPFNPLNWIDQSGAKLADINRDDLSMLAIKEKMDNGEALTKEDWQYLKDRKLGNQDTSTPLPPGVQTALRITPDALAAFLGTRKGSEEPPEGGDVTLGKSGGAASANLDLSKASPELREQIEQAAREGNLNPDAVRRHLEADSLGIKLSRGQATQDPTILSLEMNSRGKNAEFANLYNEQNRQLIDKLDELRADTAPNVVGNDHIQNGQTLIDSYKNYDQAVTTDIRAKYKALEAANGGEFPLDAAQFVTNADKALKSKMKTRYLPSQIASDLEDFRESGSMTFENFDNLRTNLAAEARKAERSGDGNAAMAVNIVRRELEEVPMPGPIGTKLKGLSDAARNAAKARFDRLEADPAYRAAAEDSVKVGEASPLADDFIPKYVVRGKSANIQTMRDTLKNDPQAAETIAAGALNYLKAKSGVNLYTNEGNFSQAGYNKALSELTPKLRDLVSPEVAEKAQTIGNVARYTQARPKGSFVNESNTFTSMAGEHMKGAAEGFVNLKAGGVPVGTWFRKMMQGRSDKQFVQESLEPGAGVRLPKKPQSP
jgi:hypothetical protein